MKPQVWIYDIECYRNYFLICFKNYKDKNFFDFEISDYKNDIKELIQFIKKDFYIGFNNLHYDSPVLNYVCKNKVKLFKLTGSELSFKIWEFSQRIINNVDNDKDINEDLGEKLILSKENQLSLFDNVIQYEKPFSVERYRGNNRKLISEYKYKKKWIDIDVFMTWSKKVRIARKISLKGLACHMNWPLIQELPIKPEELITEENRDLMLYYCHNDVNITEAVFEALKEEIMGKFNMISKFGTDVLNWDGPKIGVEGFILDLSKELDIDLEELKKGKTYNKSLKLDSIIIPIEYKVNNSHDLNLIYTMSEKKKKKTKDKNKEYYSFTSIYKVYNWLKTLEVNSTTDFSYNLYLKNPDDSILEFIGGGGGAHALVNKNSIIPNENQILETEDVASYYPTSIVNFKAMPDHLPLEKSLNLYDSKKKLRVSIKKSDPKRASELKLELNAFYGNLNNQYSPLYDWKQLLKVTINGQLIFLYIVEQLIEIGVNIISVNTDGLEILYDKKLETRVGEIFLECGQKFNYEFEKLHYEKIYYLNVNNYLACCKDNKPPKLKGLFNDNPDLENGHDSLIIAKALKHYIVENKDYKDFIYNHDNIFDFCNSFKIQKKYKIFYSNKIIQNLNRFYAGINQPYLYKKHSLSKDYEHVFKKSGVVLLNDYEKQKKTNIKEYYINYDYYIKEVEEILNQLGLLKKETVQMKLL